nr:M4 family metallopeptidase [Kutzneria albida]
MGGALAAGLVVAATAAVLPSAEATTPDAVPSARAQAVSAANALVAARPAALHASADDKFVQHAVISGQNAQYVPYDRTYKGLPVVGGDFVVATDNAGHPTYTSVAQDQVITLGSVSPVLGADRAKSVARGQLKRVDSVAEPVLSVLATGSPRLVWDTRVTGNSGAEPSSLSVYVDAANGSVQGTREHVLHGDGNGAYNGPSPLHLDTTHSGSSYSLQDPNIANLSCQDYSSGQVFEKSTDTWGDGKATSKETDCVDSLFAAQTEHKMLKDWLGRDGADGNGGAWPIQVGLDDINAYYDGNSVRIGHNTANQWIGAMDVVGHEMGHGVDDHTPGGISGNGTQEFVADTFGAETEWYANESAPYDTPDFTVGETINLQGRGPIRYMYDPSKAGHANCYSSSVPNSEVHAAAGPGNHWFYLLAEGTNPSNGQPTSPTCNNTSVTGLGIQNAAKIMYNAMLVKTSSSSYLKYRTWTLQAAKTVFPEDCTAFNTVKAAWDAVSVPAQSGDPTCSGPTPTTTTTPPTSTTTAPPTGTVTVTSPGDQWGFKGYKLFQDLQVKATASDGGALTFSATGLPAGVTISSSGLISGTPTTAGTTTVTVTAKEANGTSGSASFKFQIYGF